MATNISAIKSTGATAPGYRYIRAIPMQRRPASRASLHGANFRYRSAMATNISAMATNISAMATNISAIKSTGATTPGYRYIRAIPMQRRPASRASLHGANFRHRSAMRKYDCW